LLSSDKIFKLIVYKLASRSFLLFSLRVTKSIINLSLYLAVRRETSLDRDSFIVEMSGKGLKRVPVESVDQAHHAAVRRQQDGFAVRAEILIGYLSVWT